MKRLFKISLVAIVEILLFVIVVTAHSGKTDSAGGHYNNSSGEYHYHHGYSAHQHYDMDGDGVVDCPYDFNNKTNHNNNSSSNSSNKINNSTSISENKIEKTKNKITFGKAIGIILSIILLSLMTLYLLYIVFGIIGITIVWFIEKYFKVSIEESIQQRILNIFLIIGLVIIVPIEILFLLGIL